MSPSVSYNTTNPASVFISNSSSVIYGLEAAAVSDPDVVDPLDLKNTLMSFEYHLGDKQTQRMFVELVNPGTTIEQKLFASYAAIAPRASAPPAYKGVGGDELLKEALEDRVYYVRWGYMKEEVPGVPPTYALSHVHRVELINLHYSFSAKKERIFKLELVDSYTKGLFSREFNTRPHTVEVPLNTMDSWRDAATVLQEVLLQMLTQFEGYVGYSKLSGVQTDIINNVFRDTVRKSVGTRWRDDAKVENAIEGIVNSQPRGFDNSEIRKWLPAMQAANGNCSPARAFRLSGEEAKAIFFMQHPDAKNFLDERAKDWASTAPSLGLAARITDQAQREVAASQAIRSLQGVKDFYEEWGLTFVQAAGIAFDSLMVDKFGDVVAQTAGSPQIPMANYSENQYGGHTTGPILLQKPNDIKDRPWLNAVTEASRVSQDERVYRQEVITDQMDQKERMYEGSLTTSSLHFWGRNLGYLSKAWYCKKSPYGGFTTGLTRADLQAILTKGKAPVLYGGAFSTSISDTRAQDYYVAFYVYKGVNDIENDVEFPLTNADRLAIEATIQEIEADEQEWLAQTDFDPTQPPEAATVVDNTALESYGGALGAGEPASQLSDIYPDVESYEMHGYASVEEAAADFFEQHANTPIYGRPLPGAGFNKNDLFRSNPYMVPPQYRNNVKLLIRAGLLLETVNAVLKRLNDIYFKSADKYLQFLKIEVADIPIDKRDAFELALGVNISEEAWKDSEGFVILTTSDFIKKLFAIIDDGRIVSFPAIDLYDEEAEVSKTIGLSIGYDNRDDGILKSLQWTYNIPHALYGLRQVPFSVSKIINVAKRWASLDSGSSSPNGITWSDPSITVDPSNYKAGDGITPALIQVLGLALQLNTKSNWRSDSDSTSPSAAKLRASERGSHHMKDASLIRTGPEATDTSLKLGDRAFTDAAIQAALAQVVKMNRVDLSGMKFYDATTASELPQDLQNDLKDSMLEDLKYLHQEGLMEIFFPTLDPTDSAMIFQNYFVDGRLLNVKRPVFRKINKAPLSLFAKDPGTIDEALAKELIIAKTEWLNKIAKTVINAKSSLLGVPEMDIVGDEIFNRNIYIDVHEPRDPGTKHWLSGVYNVRDIVHKINPKDGYIQDMTLVRSNKDTAEYMEKLNLIRATKAATL